MSCKEKYVASVTELQLASVSPATGYPGAIITVYGRNFSNEFGENKVFIGEKEAKVLEYNSWDLTVVVPEQECYGAIYNSRDPRTRRPLV